MGAARITEEERLRILELYREGKIASEIAEIVYRDKTVIQRYINQAAENGEVVKRDKRRRQSKLTPEERLEHERAKKRKYNQRQRDKRKAAVGNDRRRTFNPPKGENFKQPLKEKPDGVVVNCTRKVSRQCVYGFENPVVGSALCNYILCEGHMRGCPPEACTHFAKVSKDNPRRRSMV